VLYVIRCLFLALAPIGVASFYTGEIFKILTGVKDTTESGKQLQKIINIYEHDIKKAATAKSNGLILISS
jgi:hypothetical protein